MVAHKIPGLEGQVQAKAIKGNTPDISKFLI
jgi:hypothetical protein